MMRVIVAMVEVMRVVMGVFALPMRTIPMVVASMGSRVFSVGGECVIHHDVIL
jgi:hypothetical protein